MLRGSISLKVLVAIGFCTGISFSEVVAAGIVSASDVCEHCALSGCDTMATVSGAAAISPTTVGLGSKTRGGRL